MVFFLQILSRPHSGYKNEALGAYLTSADFCRHLENTAGNNSAFFLFLGPQDNPRECTPLGRRAQEERVPTRCRQNCFLVSKSPWCTCWVSHIMNGILPMSLNVYDSCTLPVLAYEEETWRLTKTVQLKLRTTQRVMERKMIGVTLRHKTRTECVTEQTHFMDVILEIRRRGCGQGV